MNAMNRAAHTADAVQDSIDSNTETIPAPALPTPAPRTFDPSDVAYDLPGDITVTWAELGMPDEAAILALASKNPSTWTFEEERAAVELLNATPDRDMTEPHIALLFAHGEAEDARLRREGATSADLDD